ncbi:MAG: class IV adenylate cyclase [bacterium]|nr:class IV adenylate cyclase [bacterium]
MRCLETRYPAAMEGTTESELKIPVSSLDDIRQSLVKLGARRLAPAGREVNIVFDYADSRLQDAESILRLRHAEQRLIVTFKGPPSYEDQVKHREELELTISDGEALTRILSRLGLEPVRRYEKDRERWCLDDTEVVLDRTPMGEFVEIEGPSQKLGDIAARLGLDSSHAVRASYLGLWDRHRELHPEIDLPRDMVFDE